MSANDVNRATLFKEYISLNARDTAPIAPQNLKRMVKSAKSQSNSTLLNGRKNSEFSLDKAASKTSLSNIMKPSLSARIPVAADGNLSLHVSGLSISGTGRPMSGDLLKAHSSSQISSTSPYRPQTTEPRPTPRLNNYTAAKSMASLRSAEIPPKVYAQRKVVLKPPVELPAWNVSARPAVPFPNPKNPETALPVAPKKETPRVSIAMESTSTLISNSEIFEEEKDLLFKKEYQPSPYQLEMCSEILPAFGDTAITKRSDHFITQAFAIADQKFDLDKLENCINKVVSEFTILSMNAVRNTKIIDADIKCYSDTTPLQDIKRGAYLTSKYVEFDDEIIPISQISELVQSWKAEKKLHDSAFGCLLINGQAGSYNQFLIFGASRAIMDELSLIWLSKKILHLFANDAWEAYKAEEVTSYEDFYNQTYRTRSDLSFWRDQCIEVSQDNVNADERIQFEKKLKTLRKEIQSLKTSLVSATKRKPELEQELSQLRKERMAIDAHKNEQPVYITDPTTGNTIEMTKAAKTALMKAVLGEEAIGENITPFLNKHDVSNDIQRKINAHYMTLEEFATLTAPAVEPLNLSTKDKRQLMALAEYVRNRIKECVQEQGKVKFTIERQISKITRALEAATDDYNTTIKKIDLNEDMTFRLDSILHPPFVEKLLAPIELKASPQSDQKIDQSKWGFLDFVVNDETLDNLHKFRAEWTNNIRNRRKKQKSDDADDSDNESLLEFSDDDANFEEAQEKKLKEHSVGAVCLAAFGVLMRHITGNNNFLIGVNTSYRTKGSIVGPYSDIMPVKIDLSKKGLSFSSLFSSLYRIFRNIKRHGSTCPSAYLSKQLKIELEFPVQFHFISKREYKEWIKTGLSENDLLKPQEISTSEDAPQMERLWSESSQDNYSIKFIMIEKDTHIVCGVRYLTSMYDEEKVTKWITKFQSTLEGIDCSRRKLSVTSMITRFYNPIWKSNSSISASSSNSLRASSMYLFSSNELDQL